jgi:hypothetical protein
MPFQLRWWDPDKILMIEFTDHVTAGDIVDGATQGAEELDAALSALHCILDFRRMSQLQPVQLTQLAELVAFFQHPNLSWLAFLGVNSILEFWLKVFVKNHGLRYTVFNTPEDAVAFLQDVDRNQRPIQ